MDRPATSNGDLISSSQHTSSRDRSSPFQFFWSVFSRHRVRQLAAPPLRAKRALPRRSRQARPPVQAAASPAIPMKSPGTLAR